MARQILVSAAAAGLLAAALVAAPAASATPLAPVTPGASAYSAAADVGGSSLHATVGLGGAIGGLLNSVVGPIITTAVNPLINALQATINTTVGTLLGAGSSYTAGTPSQQDSGNAISNFPGDTVPPGPGACSAASATQPCYQATNIGLNVSPLLNLSVPLITGYTREAGSDPALPIYGRARVTSPSISVLPGIVALTNPLVSAGTIDALATCPNDGKTAPSTQVSTGDITLLGGLIKLRVLNGAIAALVVNGTTIGSLSSLPVTTLPGSIVVQSYGTALRVDVPLGLDQLLAGLGLGNSPVSQLLNYLTSASLKLTLLVGPNSTVTATSAKAWGLGIGVDLSGSFNLNLLGLVTATIAVPTGIGGGNYGNVLDARLAYAACQNGSGGTTGGGPAVVPPALI